MLVVPAAARLLLSALACRSALGLECAADYGSCFDHQTCCNEAPTDGINVFGCFRMLKDGALMHYAQCRPWDIATCTDTSDWVCPGWTKSGAASDPERAAMQVAARHPCTTANFGDCWDSQCCSSSTAFGCYRKVKEGKAVQYAQCRRKDDNCEDTEEWLVRWAS